MQIVVTEIHMSGHMLRIFEVKAKDSVEYSKEDNQTSLKGSARTIKHMGTYFFFNSLGRRGRSWVKVRGTFYIIGVGKVKSDGQDQEFTPVPARCSRIRRIIRPIWVQTFSHLPDHSSEVLLDCPQPAPKTSSSWFHLGPRLLTPEPREGVSCSPASRIPKRRGKVEKKGQWKVRNGEQAKERDRER